MRYVIIILVGLWLFSYVNFRRRYKLDRMMCEFIRDIYDNDSCNFMVGIEYGSALMQSQQYQSALKIFESVKNRIANANVIYPFLNENIEFCKKPLPWSNGAKDHKGGCWWHDFQLNRFGGRRQVVISKETNLAFNAMLRMMSR